MENLKILLVEDDPSLAVLFQRMLVRMGHTVVGIVPTETTVSAKILRSAPDLVLIDVVLADGIEGLELAHGVTSSIGIPGIVMSNYSRRHLMERDASVAEYHFIRKPFFVEDLAAVISQATSYPTDSDADLDDFT